MEISSRHVEIFVGIYDKYFSCNKVSGGPMSNRSSIAISIAASNIYWSAAASTTAFNWQYSMLFSTLFCVGR
jgi:hypothetical protein